MKAEEVKLIEIGSKVWEFRKRNGFSKKLSLEIQEEMAKLCQSGITAYALEKATGVQRHRIMDWKNKFTASREAGFSELNIVEGLKPNFELKLSGMVQGCRVEITGTDYSLLQSLLKKMS